MHTQRSLRVPEGGLEMLALGIALVVIALFSPLSVPTFVVWLIGIAALGFWMGKSAAEPVKKAEVSEHENR